MTYVAVDALFIGSLQSNATPSQMTYWFQKGAVSLSGMIGCFAMTELGHGSNVPGLETTATFEEGANQFIIHTPTLTATKASKAYNDIKRYSIVLLGNLIYSGGLEELLTQQHTPLFSLSSLFAESVMEPNASWCL